LCESGGEVEKGVQRIVLKWILKKTGSLNVTLIELAGFCFSGEETSSSIVLLSYRLLLRIFVS